jgi:hypothetical protein
VKQDQLHGKKNAITRRSRCKALHLVSLPLVILALQKCFKLLTVVLFYGSASVLLTNVTVQLQDCILVLLHCLLPMLYSNDTIALL